MFHGDFLSLLSSCGGTGRLADEAKATPDFEMPEVTTNTDTCWVYTHLNKSGESAVETALKDSWGQRSDTYDSTQWRKGDGHLHSIGEDLSDGQKMNVVGGEYAEALRRSSSAAASKCQ